MIPRDYQVSAVAAARADMAEFGSALLALPTGAGKSACCGFIIAEEAAKDPRSRFMVLQHRDELLNQNCATITAITGLPASVVKAEQDDWSGQIIYASSATLARKNRRERMVPLSHIVVDEAHHIEADGYRKILDHARSLHPGLKLLGLSATPERADGRGLKGTFERVSFSVQIGQLIDEGVLVRPSALTVSLADEELSAIDDDGAEFDMGQADEVLNRAVHNDAVVEHWLEHAAGRRTIFFCTTIDHARAVSEAFKRAGVTSELISSKTPMARRAALLRAFDTAEITVLTNCMVLTEGYDNQVVSCIGILRPMLHQSTFIQAVGRGLRRVDPERYPGIIKTDCIILDFAGAAARHGSLESMLGLHDGKQDDGDDGWTEGEEEEDEGAGVTPIRHLGLTAIELLGNSPFRWEALMGDQSRRIASGFEAFAAVLASDIDDIWVSVGKVGKYGRIKTLHVGAEAQAICAADDFMRLNETSQHAKDGRAWLRMPATQPQIDLLRKFSIDAAFLTRYEASCLIGWSMNKAEIQKAMAGATK